ncbi:MAG: OmpA family protein [Clostridium sp.]|nr:OmpA family protein [Clostridium sp.]
MARHIRKSQNEETSYWLSYSDMMAALLLVFVLIISFTMLQAKKQYEDRTKKLEIQEELIEEQQKIMSEQQEQLDRIIGVKSNLIEDLKKAFDGTDLKVSVDPQTGAITFDSSILFDVNMYDLKPSGEEFLEAFLPRYLNVLLQDEYKSYISEIIIEGHTDTNGTYMHNLELSQERALSVATFCLKDDTTILSPEERDSLRSIVTANGKSFSNPIYNADGSVNLEASRRVEFKFRLKDEDMVNEMIKILAE